MKHFSYFQLSSFNSSPANHQTRMAACRSSRGLAAGYSPEWWTIYAGGIRASIRLPSNPHHLTVGNPRISGSYLFRAVAFGRRPVVRSIATLSTVLQQHPVETRLPPLGCCRRVVSAVIDRERSGTARETREKRTNGERKKRSSSIRLIRMTRTCCPRRKRTREGGKIQCRNRGTT